MKKGQIWISAVLYIALGVVAISIVLSAGVPLINKIKDKNTIVQTKDILFAVDNIIRKVRECIEFFVIVCIRGDKSLSDIFSYLFKYRHIYSLFMEKYFLSSTNADSTIFK